MQIMLTPNEVCLAASHGVIRRSEKLRKKRREYSLTMPHSWDNEIEACCAELAFCKMRGVYWTGAQEFRARDGGSVEIRWTRHLNKGGLILTDRDNDDDVFVLMDGFAPNYNIVGWLRASDGKVEAYRSQYGYLVPRTKLRPIKRKNPNGAPAIC